MNKFTVGAVVVVLLAFGGLIAWSAFRPDSKIDFNKYTSETTPSDDKISVRQVLEKSDDNGNIGDHVRGKADSKIIVYEYADIQCPGCASMMPKMHKIYEQFGDSVAFVFRHYNLNYHQNARAASAAAEAAGMQGYFWEMLEAEYDSQAEWEEITDTIKRTDTFARIFEEATDGKGDVDKFRNDLNSPDIQKKIDFDIGLGKQVDKIDATPYIMVGEKKIEIGDSTQDDIAKEINLLLTAQEEAESEE